MRHPDRIWTSNWFVFCICPHPTATAPSTVLYVYTHTYISCQLAIQCHVSSVVDTTLHNNYTHKHHAYSVGGNEVKLPQCIPWKQKEVGWWGNRGIAPLILKLSITWRWMDRFMPRLLYSQGKNSYHQLNRRLHESQSLSATLPGIKTWTNQPIA